jgi:hypothetical protein
MRGYRNFLEILKKHWLALSDFARVRELTFKEEMCLIQITSILRRWQEDFFKDSTVQKRLNEVWVDYLTGGCQDPMPVISYMGIASLLYHSDVAWKNNVVKMQELWNKEEKSAFQRMCFRFKKQFNASKEEKISRNNETANENIDPPDAFCSTTNDVLKETEIQPPKKASVDDDRKEKCRARIDAKLDARRKKSASHNHFSVTKQGSSMFSQKTKANRFLGTIECFDHETYTFDPAPLHACLAQALEGVGDPPLIPEIIQSLIEESKILQKVGEIYSLDNWPGKKDLDSIVLAALLIKINPGQSKQIFGSTSNKKIPSYAEDRRAVFITSGLLYRIAACDDFDAKILALKNLIDYLNKRQTSDDLTRKAKVAFSAVRDAVVAYRNALPLPQPSASP